MNNIILNLNSSVRTHASLRNSYNFFAFEFTIEAKSLKEHPDWTLAMQEELK